MPKLSKELAQQEVTNWLDSIDVSKDDQKASEVNIDIIISAMSDGNIFISGKEITLTLRKPVGTVTSLTFKMDFVVDDVQHAKKAIDKEYDNRNTAASICASTGQLYGVIGQMNNRDFNVAAAIIPFFMV